MDCRRVATVDVVLALRLAVNVLQRQPDLDQLWLVPEITAHTGSTPRSHSFCQLPIMPVAAKSPKSTSRNGSPIERIASDSGSAGCTDTIARRNPVAEFFPWR